MKGTRSAGLVAAVRLPVVFVVGLMALAATAQAANLSPTQQVQLVQSALTILGFPPGRIDGIDGPTTRDALSAAAIARDWSRVPQAIDGRVVEDLNRAAAAALAWRFAIRFDGRWILDPNRWDSTMAADAGIDHPVTLAGACAARGPQSFIIDGLIYTAGGGATWVMILDGARLVPVRPEGRPVQSEVHGFAVVDLNTLESLTEGDTAQWRRCPEG